MYNWWMMRDSLILQVSHSLPMQDVRTAGWVAGRALLQALGPALLMNICIVGLNQLYDVEIDRVNKPYLPLASGELSEQQGRWLVAGTGAKLMRTACCAVLQTTVARNDSSICVLCCQSMLLTCNCHPSPQAQLRWQSGLRWAPRPCC